MTRRERNREKIPCSICGKIISRKQEAGHKNSARCFVARSKARMEADGLEPVLQCGSARVRTHTSAPYSEPRYKALVSVVDHFRSRGIKARLSAYAVINAGWAQSFQEIEMRVYVEPWVADLLRERFDYSGKQRDDNEIGRMTEDQFFALLAPVASTGS